MIDIIFLDVDGCMSDGGIIYTNSGDEIKRFDVKDGFGIQQWIKLGKKAAIITGKSSKIVEKRAAELGINYVFQGVSDKLKIAEEILEKENLSFKNAAAIGDDYNDIKLLKNVALSFKPIDAMKNVEVDIILEAKGGYGAVRQMIETIIDIENLREIWLQKWL